MPRACTICTDPHRPGIDRALLAGASLRDTARQYGTSKDAVGRHKNSCLARIVAAGLESAGVRIAPDIATGSATDRTGIATAEPAEHGRQTRQQRAATVAAGNRETAAYVARRAAADRAGAVDVFAELLAQLERLTALYDALDMWLRDPDAPDTYTIDPRAHEVQVIYEEYGEDDDRPRRRRAPLSHLLAHVEQATAGRVAPVSGETKIADPRKLLIDVSAELRQQMALRVQIISELTNAGAVAEYQRTVLAAIETVAPELRAAIVEELRRHQPIRRIYWPGAEGETTA